MTPERDINEQFGQRFLSTQEARALLEEEHNVITEQSFDNNSGHIRLKLAYGLSDDDRTGLYEAYVTEEGFKRRLVYCYKQTPWVNPHYTVVFSKGEKFKDLNSKAKFYKVPEGITAERVEVSFQSRFGGHPSNAHIFQANYYARDCELGKKGELIYMLYSSPFYRDPSIPDLNQNIGEKTYTRMTDLKPFRVVTNVPDWDLQMTNTNSYTLTCPSRLLNNPIDFKKAIMFCHGDIDLDIIERLIMEEGDNWKTIERELWPISYVVNPNG